LHWGHLESGTFSPAHKASASTQLSLNVLAPSPRHFANFIGIDTESSDGVLMNIGSGPSGPPVKKKKRRTQVRGAIEMGIMEIDIMEMGIMKMEIDEIGPGRP